MHSQIVSEAEFEKCSLKQLLLNLSDTVDNNLKSLQNS